jgi:hypothetical protein
MEREQKLIDDLHRDPSFHPPSGFVGWWQRWVGSIAFVILIAICAGGLTYVQNDAENLREGLIEGCEKNGNTLREVVRGQLEDEIDQNENLNYEELFPQIPPEQLEQLIETDNEQNRQSIADLAAVDCRALYED